MQTNNNNWFEQIDCLKDKAIVDLANGLDISRDHQKIFDSQSFPSRLINSLSGKNQKRQGEVNKALTEGLESSLTWLTELTESVASSNLAIKSVNQRVDKLSTHMTNLMGDYLQTRKQLQTLTDVTSDRLTELASDIANLNLEVKAKTHLDLVFSKWSSGYWYSYSIATRCYITLEELRWGTFGDFIRNTNPKERSDYLELLKNKVIEQLAIDSGTTVQDRIDSNTWIACDRESNIDAINFLGDWCIEHKQPTTFFVTQQWDTASIYMPRIISASKLGSSLTEEIFHQEAA